MKKIEESKFEEIYDKLYNKYYTRFEEMRISSTKNFKHIIEGFFCIVIVVFLLSASSEVLLCIGLPLVIIGGRLILREILFKKDDNYSELYKNEVIAEFIKNILPDFNYLPDFSLEFENKIIYEYKNAKFDTRKFNRSYADDYVSGKIQNNDIYMCDLYTCYEYVDENDETRIKERFSGLFAKIRINSANRKVAIKILNKENSIIENRNIVELDYDEFNNNFIIVSDSNIIAFQILTAEVMQILNKMLKEHNIKFDISIIDDNIYFRFYTPPIFEAPINESVMKKENFYKYYTLLNFIINFSNNINDIYKNLNI